jgi:hypothetical protein
MKKLLIVGFILLFAVGLFVQIGDATRAGEGAGFIVLQALGLLLFELAWRFFEKKRMPIIAQYFEENRKKYEWLNEHLNKEENKNLAEEKAKKEALFNAIFCLIVSLLLGSFLNMVFNSFGIHLNTNIYVIALGVITLLLFYKFAVISNPHYDECPKCGCPLAWNIVDEKTEKIGSSTETVTHTTTTTYTDGSKEYDRTDVDYKVNKFEETITYLCSSCGHIKKVKETFTQRERVKHFLDNTPFR